MNDLKLNLSQDKLFQVKAAIIFLSRNFEEIDDIINEANSDVESVLIAATVKEERG